DLPEQQPQPVHDTSGKGAPPAQKPAPPVNVKPAPPKSPLATCTSTGTGNWSSAATWSCGFVPTAADDVIISTSSTVTIDTAAVALNVTINAAGILMWDLTTARTLTVGGSVTLAAGGQFLTDPGSTIT